MSAVAVCPLCSTDFEKAMCHASCPLSKGCAMVRCPRCSHEFLDPDHRGWWQSKLESWKGRHDDSPAV